MKKWLTDPGELESLLHASGWLRWRDQSGCSAFSVWGYSTETYRFGCFRLWCQRPNYCRLCLERELRRYFRRASLNFRDLGSGAFVDFIDRDKWANYRHGVRYSRKRKQKSKRAEPSKVLNLGLEIEDGLVMAISEITPRKAATAIYLKPDELDAVLNIGFTARRDYLKRYLGSGHRENLILGNLPEHPDERRPSSFVRLGTRPEAPSELETKVEHAGLTDAPRPSGKAGVDVSHMLKLQKWKQHIEAVLDHPERIPR